MSRSRYLPDFPNSLAVVFRVAHRFGMKRRLRIVQVGCAILFFGGLLARGADDIKMEWLASNIVSKASAYTPVRLNLSSDKPQELKSMPADVTAPLYGKIQLGPSEATRTFLVILDEPDGSPARLFVDANGTGELAGAQPSEWTPRAAKSRDGTPLTNYFGGAVVHLSYAGEKLDLRLGMYRFDPHDTSRPDYTSLLLYYRDYGRAGEITVDGKTYKSVLLDDGTTGDFRPAHETGKSAVKLLVDLNNDGKFDARKESFDISGPFKIGEQAYEVTGMSPIGDSFQLVKSTKPVLVEAPRTPRPPRVHLTVGSNAPAFDAKTMDGDSFHFPDKYKGKLVILDFWATWCPPCRGEIPGVSAAYQKYHSQGLEILGVSLDQGGEGDMLAKFTKDNNMPWPEVYDGQNWKAAVAQIYSIDSIPHPFLVDGNTGKIVAEGNELRGENLAATIEKALAQHH